MKFDVTVNGRPAKLVVEGGHCRYERDAGLIESEFSVEPLEPGAWSVLMDGRSYRVVAGAGDAMLVNGLALEVEVLDPRELRARQKEAAGHGRQNIAALMPGKVIRVLVQPGDVVEAGQGLIVVEAMKMQNEMKSPTAGRVAAVKTKPDATVAAGEVLVVIE